MFFLEGEVLSYGLKEIVYIIKNLKRNGGEVWRGKGEVEGDVGVNKDE